MVSVVGCSWPLQTIVVEAAPLVFMVMCTAWHVVLQAGAATSARFIDGSAPVRW